MKTYILLQLILLCAIPHSGFTQQQLNKIKPLVSVDMEAGKLSDGVYSLHGKDSIVGGIIGEAKYFSNELENIAFIRIEEQESLNQLWIEHDFSVEVWVQTTALNNQYQVIAANKNWNSGEIKDFTTNHEFGISRTSGHNKGWAIICQPDGSWAWNIGDGRNRLDYRPIAPRQQINDGEWHQIAFTVNSERKEVRMYFDGVNVAIYNIRGIYDMDSQLPVCLGTDPLEDRSAPFFEGAIDEFSIYDYVISADAIAENYRRCVPAARLPEMTNQRVNNLNLMTWNIWHGGRRHGREIGPQQVIDFIKDTDTDIVMMQETYGSGALIADALEYYFYLASTNISVISKYPILETMTIYDAFRCGLTTIELSKGQKINLASLWIHYLPAWRSDAHASDATAEKLIKGEEETRHKEIKEIVSMLNNQIQETDDIPFIIGGDFNSPSHLDWVSQTKKWHNGLVVEWPVSKIMMEAGFKDSFREIRPDLNYASPTMSAERITHRIDYIYYKGKKIKAIESDIHYKYKGIWPSDHPAVTTTFSIK